MMNAIQEPFYVAPQDWVALTGPCPTCEGHGQLWHIGTISKGPSAWKPCPDCRDGRRIVPLYRECLVDGSSSPSDDPEWCACGDGYPLVGRASIEVVPVVEHDDRTEPPFDAPVVCIHEGTGCFLHLDDYEAAIRLALATEPVPGRDFGIVIDCVELVHAGTL